MKDRSIPGLMVDYGEGPQPMDDLRLDPGVSIPAKYAQIAQGYLVGATSSTSRAELARIWGPTLMHAVLAADTLGLPSVNSEEPDREMKEYAHFILRWGLNGCPNFQISHSLEASLLLTDCAKVRAGELRFPFPSFMVTLPAPGSALTMRHPDGDIEPVRWVMFHTLDAPTESCREAAWATFDAALRSGRLRTNADLIALMDRLATTYEWTTMNVIRLITESGLNVFRRAPWPAEHETIEAWIGASDEIFTGLGMFEMDDTDTRCSEAGYRLCANLALYLAARLRDEPNLLVKKAPKRPRRDGDTGNPITTFTVGQEIKLGREVREAAQALMQRGTRAGGWTLKSRHVVRGHWKHQPKGHHRADRERIWVQPYWRGEDLTTAVTRQYAVQQPEESK